MMRCSPSIFAMIGAHSSSSLTSRVANGVGFHVRAGAAVRGWLPVRFGRALFWRRKGPERSPESFSAQPHFLWIGVAGACARPTQELLSGHGHRGRPELVVQYCKPLQHMLSRFRYEIVCEFQLV